MPPAEPEASFDVTFAPLTTTFKFKAAFFPFPIKAPAFFPLICQFSLIVSFSVFPTESDAFSAISPTSPPAALPLPAMILTLPETSTLPT